MKAVDAWAQWSPRGSTIRTIDAHTEGEPLRVVLAGFPEPQGRTILERRRFARERLDHLRTALIWEPRGHADMYGCLIVPPATPDADFGVLFLHNDGYSTMCGHGIIAVTTVVIETGFITAVEPTTTVRIDTPAGLVTATAFVSGSRVERVEFRNVASFVSELDVRIDVPGIGPVSYDLAYGGAWYAFVDAVQLGLDCSPASYRRIIAAGVAIKKAVAASRTITHPLDPDLGFLYGTIFVARPSSPDAHSRNVCVFADGEVDRSPTGTGVSGRVAIHYARGQIRTGETLVIESIIGTRFTARVAGNTEVAGVPAVFPEVGGTAHITGRHEFVIDDDDPLTSGFFLR